METKAILLAAAILAVPISVKYLLAFEVRTMLDVLRQQEREVRLLTAQLRALEQEKATVRRAAAQVETQRRRARAQRSLVQERLGHVLGHAEQAPHAAA
jgi:FtsZ-binding cell division protein ZapB